MQVNPKAEATYGLTPYGATNQNPISYADPDGELAWFAPLIGSAVGILSNGLSNISQGNGFFDGAEKAAIFGAVSATVSAGIGEAFGATGSFGHELGRGITHAASSGIISKFQGGSFGQGFLSGGISSGIGSGIDALGGGAGHQILGGGIGGGIGAVIAGENFFTGFGQGIAVGAFNHALHSAFMSGGPPWEYNGKRYNTKGELYRAILIDQAAEQFGIKDIAALAAVISGQPILETRGKFGGATKGTSPASKYLSKIPGEFTGRGLPSLTGHPKALGGRGMRVAFTKSVGRFLGRAVPIVGWATLAYDVGATFYHTQTTYNSIINQ